MAGIYLHIPFCKQKCHYCNFFSVASLKHRAEFLASLLNEIGERKDYLGEEEVTTIYFGGGTPSLLSATELRRILDALADNFKLSAAPEITLEANPDDVSKAWLKELKTTPVNRLSIGIQSFFDDDLEYLNRVHNAQQAREVVEQARDAGYPNLTIDLIYGIPGLSMEKWQKNLETFFSMEIPHLSAYALTVEARTALHHLIEKKKLPAPDEQESVDHFRLLQKLTAEKGYQHYEISNFSLPGHYSKHNSIYWLGGNYLGLGPSAHSFNGTSREWNVSNLGKYVSGEWHSGSEVEKEILTAVQRYNEYVMTSLRTMWGCDSTHIRNGFGDSFADYFLKGTARFIDRGWLRSEGSAFFLTDEGKLFADGVASALFLEED